MEKNYVEDGGEAALISDDEDDEAEKKEKKRKRRAATLEENAKPEKIAAKVAKGVFNPRARRVRGKTEGKE